MCDLKMAHASQDDEESAPLVLQINSARFSSRIKGVLGIGISILGVIACTAAWYWHRDSFDSQDPNEFTGVEFAELATCGRKLSWWAHPGMCAAAKGPWDGAELTVQPCGTVGFLDEWIFTKEGNTTRARLAAAPEFCINVMGQRKPYPGAPLHVARCSEAENKNQHFNLTKKGQVESSSDLCMDVQYGSSSPGTVLQLWHCQRGSNQFFKLMPCLESCFKQVHFKKTGQCLTTVGWHLKEGVALTSAGCLDTHIGASQFKFRNSGGSLQLALNLGLCVEAKGSNLHLAKCAENNLQQEFVLSGALSFGGGQKACVVTHQANQLQVSNQCNSKLPEVQAFSTGCESVLHPMEAAQVPKGKHRAGCPRQLKWSMDPKLCIGTMQWQVGNGQHLALALCEDHGIDLPRQHWLFTTGRA